MSIYIIAEAGVNHNGSLDIAMKLVDMACECKANAIKFQTFKAYESTSTYAEKALYQKNNTLTSESQYEMIKNLELDFECFKQLKAYCKLKEIDFLSTPDGIESLNYLVSLGLDTIKIGSSEITNHTFLKEVSKTKKKIILSTGMSYLGEVEKAIQVIKSCDNENIILMHCTTDYPTSLVDVNIKAMVTMQKAFNLPVGFSDHTLGNEAALSAATLGAVVIEKHITLDNLMEGPDHKASMNKENFKMYVEAIRNVELLLGTGIKKPTTNELTIMKDVRRSIVAKSDLPKGTILTEDMLDFKRPGYGIKPELAYLLIGKILNKDILFDEIILWEDLNNV